MSIVAVTGASTPLGMTLLRLLDADATVTRIVAIDGRPPALESPKLKFFEADSHGPVRSGLEKFKVTRAVHLDLRFAGRDEAGLRRANVGGSASFLTACLAAQTVESVVLLSSTLVYGAQPQGASPVRETAAFGPTTLPLAQQLQEIERYCQTHRDRYPQMKVNVARLAPVPGAQPEHFILQGLLKPPAALGQLNPALQFVHADDAARALHTLVLGQGNGAYNVAADDAVTLRAAWQTLRVNPPGRASALLGFAQRLPAGQLDAWRQGWLVDNRLLKQEFGFTYRCTSAQALTALAPTA